jgi:hypothetical protein
MKEINEADGFVSGANPRPDLIKRFKKLINTQGLSESRYQAFFEEHPEFLMQPFLLNHQLHFDAIVSQFRLTTNLTADFCYLTKSTASWWLVLVEIEPPDVPLFRANKLRLIRTADFNERIAQIEDWRDAVSLNGPQIIAGLDAIRKPLTRNPVHFRYVLIVGRDPIGREEEAWRRIDQLNGFDLRILTYDSLLRNYEERRGRRCNIIGLNKGKVRFKNLNVRPDNMLAYMPPSDLLLTEDDKAKLRRWKLSIAPFEAGDAFRPKNFKKRAVRQKGEPKRWAASKEIEIT